MSDPVQTPTQAYVRQMFGVIADRYDLMNRVMTLWQDQRWRRQAVEVAGIAPGDDVLDVATGTGDLAFELARTVSPGGSVVGIDFAEPMLAQARRKATGRALRVVFERGDALQLPYDDNRFAAVTCGFGVRNFADRPLALREMTRVVRPRGRVVILELTPPSNQFARRYMDEIVPRLGQFLAGQREAYTYLPESAHAFPDALTFGRMMQAAGLRGVTYRVLNFGTIALHWGSKPEQ